MIIVTAGHIDHGKTLLVKALTGTDADRLPEEKRRGMTIDLGFAYHPLPDGTMLGFVDVPGHERFVRNMLAGVTGIDFALLIVAADDGVMPQTREHLAILDLLGIATGAIALTKIDRVDEARANAVAQEVTALVGETSLAGAPLFPVSAVTGDGVAALSEHLAQQAAALAERSGAGGFRLAIDRSFTVAGAGAVVTGTVFAGQAKIGDTLYLARNGQAVRVRGIHANNREAESGRAGQRCAVNLAGIDKDALKRGDWLVADVRLRPVRKLDVRLRVLTDEIRPLRHWTPVHVHIGAGEVTGRVALLGDTAIAPGENGLAQLVLAQPLGALARDRFIIRDQSAQRTIGGGHVIDIFPPARGRARPERIAMLEALDRPDDAAALSAAIAAAPNGLDLVQFAIARNRDDAVVAKLAHEAGAVTAGGRAFGAETWAALRKTTLAALDEYHERHADRLGPSAAQLRRAIKRAPEESVFAALVDTLTADKEMVSDGMALHRPGRSVALAPADEKIWATVLPFLKETPYAPPVVHDMARELGTRPDDISRALRRAAQIGRVLQVSKNRFLEPGPVGELATMFEALAKANGTVAPAAFRDKAGIGRNLAIELLEYFDRAGLSQRRGNERVLRRPAAEVFPNTS